MNQVMLFNAVQKWCDRNDWGYQVLEEGEAIKSGFTGDNGQFTLFFTMNNSRLMVRSLAPTNAPDAKRAALAEFVTRANYGLAIGNFELDFRDGEIAYKTSITTGGELVPDWLLKDLVYINCLMMDKHFPAMMQVIYSGTSPEAALAALE